MRNKIENICKNDKNNINLNCNTEKWFIISSMNISGLMR